MVPVCKLLFTRMPAKTIKNLMDWLINPLKNKMIVRCSDVKIFSKTRFIYFVAETVQFLEETD